MYTISTRSHQFVVCSTNLANYTLKTQNQNSFIVKCLWLICNSNIDRTGSILKEIQQNCYTNTFLTYDTTDKHKRTFTHQVNHTQYLVSSTVLTREKLGHEHS